MIETDTPANSFQTHPSQAAQFKTGLVLEGGAMRGLFSSGIIDVMMENGITVDGAVGVSAGACFGFNMKSRQIGRGLRYNLKYAGDRRYFGLWSFLTTGDVFNAKFCYQTIPQELDIVDKEAILRNPMEFWMTATDIETGEAAYHLMTDGGTTDMKWLQASSSMPLVSRPVEIDGRKYLDGGMADSIPLKFFESKQYNRIIVILTQPRGFVKPPTGMMALARILLRKYPKMVEAMANRHNMYNAETQYVFEQEKAGKILVLCPDAPLGIGRLETNKSELRRVYDSGRAMAQKRLEEIREFLKK